MRKRYPGQPDESVSTREILHRQIARRAAAEGIVLLENDGTLPLERGAAVALYGGGARYTVIGGTGSGSVNNRETVSIDEGLKNAGFTVASSDWLDDFDERYRSARERWIEEIYADAGEGPLFPNFYRAHATRPFVMPVGREIEQEACDTAIYVISRISGEGADRKAVEGDYYLSAVERSEIVRLHELYPHVVLVLNVGGIIDLSILDEYHFAAVVLLSQPGMEAGNALADVLSGEVCPSGRLTDSWAYNYEDYPGSENFSHNNGNIIEEKYAEGIYVGYRYFDCFGVKPRYPFGYGLSYTVFAEEAEGVRCEDGCVFADVKVTNTGSRAGRESILLYVSCPAGPGRPEVRRLAAFAKTPGLEPGQSCTLTLRVPLEYLEDWHAGTAAWYMRAGRYYLMTGGAAGSCITAGVLTLREDVLTRQMTNICPLHDALSQIQPDGAYGQVRGEIEAMFEGMDLPVIEIDGEVNCRVKDTGDAQPAAACGPEKAAELLSGLSVRDMARIVCGQPGSGSQEIIGAAAMHVPGAAGETTVLTEEKLGLESLVLADGPAGLRLQKRYDIRQSDGSLIKLSRFEGLENRFFGKDIRHDGCDSRWQFCTAIPIGTSLAQTFDEALLSEIGEMIGHEMREFGVDLWLAPGMNIHRNPLCGRNFEYYSEDPVVSGKMAAAITAGVQSVPGCGTTIKHLACNNQEENRRGMSSIVAERALRQIYLRGFEIAVKESQPLAVMTSYNKINGVHTANSRDLCTVFLREECGFGGIVMTDWMTTNNDGGSSAAKCIAAGNDLIMPGNVSDIEEIEDAVHCRYDLSLSRENLETCAGRILSLMTAVKSAAENP